MIQQSSMPSVSANVLAALVGSLQMPPVPIIAANGAALPPASFPALPLSSAAQSGQPLAALGTAQSGQPFSDMLVDQLAAAIVRAEQMHAPNAGGTAPPQAASPPLWAATAPSGLADAGESPGQQVVDQTGTSAGGVRPASPPPFMSAAAPQRTLTPHVAVSAPAGAPRVSPEDSSRPIGVIRMSPEDPMATRVQAIVSTIARTDAANLPAIESMRSTLLSALGSLEASRSPQADRAVRVLTGALSPTPRAGGGESERHPLAVIARTIRAASPDELVAIVRRADAGTAALPDADLQPGGGADPAAGRVYAAVATLADAAGAPPATVEALRVSLLTALAAVDPPRTPAASQVVRELSQAMQRVTAPADDTASVAPSTGASPASPVPALAEAIRTATPSELVTFMRRATPAPIAGTPSEPVAPPPVTSSYASLSLGNATAPGGRALAPSSPPVVAGSPSTGPAAALAAPVAIEGIAPPALPAAPFALMRAAVRAYDVTQPDAAVSYPQPETAANPEAALRSPATAVVASAPAQPLPVAAGVAASGSRFAVQDLAVPMTFAPVLPEVSITGLPNAVAVEPALATRPAGRASLAQESASPLAVPAEPAVRPGPEAAALDAASPAPRPAESATGQMAEAGHVRTAPGTVPVGSSEHDTEPGRGAAEAGALLGATVAAGAPATGSAAQVGTPAVPGQDAAVAAAMAEVARESAGTAPGAVREIQLRLRTDDLGTVRVRLSLDHAGAVRVDLRAGSELAAQSLRSGLPQLADALTAMNLSLHSAAVQFAPGAEFGGSNQPRQQPRWFERARRPGFDSGDAGEPVLAGIGAAAWGRGPAGVDVMA